MNKTPFLRGILIAGVLALAVTGRAQIIEFRATINAAQETPASTSPATGSAIMLYDLATNKFDLFVTISNLANTATASHIHEGAPGVAGSVVTNLGAEAAYVREGNTLRQSFRDITHGGNKLTLIQGGAYFNLHSAAFTGGEVRGQLIPQPVKLVSTMTVAQEQAAFPAVNLAGANLNDFGAAVMMYDPVANRVNLRLSVYNFNNVLNNSHFHEGAPAVSGPVRVNLGNNANAGGYTTANGHIAGTFVDISYAPGDPLLLLTGGAYLNFHSTTFTGGELRGQVRVSNDIPSTRLSNLSVRGFVGTGEQVLIQGLTVNGPDPVRVLITAKGPSLTQFGIANALANPRVGLFDAGGRQIAFNEDVGVVTATSDLATIPGVPTNTLESAMAVVLPPGNYTAIVSAAAGTGIALLEITDLRNAGLRAVADAPVEQSLAMIRARATAPATRKVDVEICAGVPLSIATIKP